MTTRAFADANGLPDSCIHFVTVPAWSIPRLPEPGSESESERSLAALVPIPLDGNGRPVEAVLRLALAGNRLLLRVDTADASPRRGVHLWEGSSVEVFVAPEPGKPRVQLIAAPELGGHPATAGWASQNRIQPLEGVSLAGGKTPTGWRLILHAPLERLGLAAGCESFALDVVVNATAPGASGLSRTHLACEHNPVPGSTCYARVTVMAQPGS